MVFRNTIYFPCLYDWRELYIPPVFTGPGENVWMCSGSSSIIPATSWLPILRISPVGYAMIYRMNLDPFLLNASCHHPPGGGLLDNTLISGSDISITVSCMIKDLLLQTVPQSRCPPGSRESVWTVPISRLMRYSTTNYRIDGNGGQVIHGVVVDSLRQPAQTVLNQVGLSLQIFSLTQRQRQVLGATVKRFWSLPLASPSPAPGR